MSSKISPTLMSKLSSSQFMDTNKFKSDYSYAKSKIGSALDRLTVLNNEKKELKKQLPCLIITLQCFLSVINFILFCVYVLLFGFSISFIITAIGEDCLKVTPSYKVVPERVTPNTAAGYECTGIRLIEKYDYYQYLFLSLLFIGIGLQMISSNLAFIGAFTLTTKNLKAYIWLFMIGTFLLVTFFVIDFILEMGKQYIRYFGALEKTFLLFMFAIAISQVFSAFFSLILLLQWNSFVKEINEKN